MKEPRKFEFKAATRERVPVLVGLTGPSGAGKTFSALRLATGIQEVAGGEIFVVDTEARRALHYAEQFKFNHVQFDAPFGSLDYLAALRQCVKAGAGVVVVDSTSHEHEGTGGLIDLHDQELERLAGDDFAKRERVKMLAWQKPKAYRRQLLNGLLQLNANFIFCFRAKETVKPIKVNGKMEIVPMGFCPIAGDEFLYEQTVNCLLLPKSNGVPTWQSDNMGERAMMKLPIQFKEIFAEPKPLDEAIGRQLAAWALGDAGSSNPERTEQPKGAVEQPTGGGTSNSDLLAELERSLRAAAGKGTVALIDEWKTLHPKHQKHFNALKERHLKADAKAADKKPPTDEEILI